VNGRLLNGWTHHPWSLLANKTTRWLRRAPLTRPAIGASAPGPPASALGMVVNSIEGVTVSVRQENASRKPDDNLASASAVRNRLVITFAFSKTPILSHRCRRSNHDLLDELRPEDHENSCFLKFHDSPMRKTGAFSRVWMVPVFAMCPACPAMTTACLPS
jgi:hypothetical protein